MVSELYVVVNEYVHTFFNLLQTVVCDTAVVRISLNPLHALTVNHNYAVACWLA